MKQGIHPENYRPVVFKDMSNGDMFLSRSTCKTNDTVEFEGETYPVVKLEISNTSHPFYTGKNKLVDTAGRVDKVMSRYAKTKKSVLPNPITITSADVTPMSALVVFIHLYPTPTR